MLALIDSEQRSVLRQRAYSSGNLSHEDDLPHSSGKGWHQRRPTQQVGDAVARDLVRLPRSRLWPKDHHTNRVKYGKNATARLRRLAGQLGLASVDRMEVMIACFHSFAKFGCE